MLKTFSPAIFNDPIAEQTDWFEVGVTEFFGYCAGSKLSKINAETFTLEFKTAPECILPYIVLFTIVLSFLIQTKIGNSALISTILLPIIYYFITAPIIFSKTKTHLRIGRNLNRIKSGINAREKQIPFDQIHAIQLIPIKVGKNSSSLSYQLNIVLRNAERINVIQNKKKEQIRKDANELSRFLGVPLWDAIDYQHIS